jgi:hypothetical protein
MGIVTILLSSLRGQWRNLTVDFVESLIETLLTRRLARTLTGSLRFVHGQFSASQRQIRLPLGDHERKGAREKARGTCQRV